MINELAVAFEQRAIRIIPDQVLLGELLSYAAERLPSGALRYSAPPGQHDDTVVALALAWSCIRNRLPAPLPSPGDPFAESKGQDAVTMTRTATGIKFLRPEHRKRGGL
jgi:hypothetical protein